MNTHHIIRHGLFVLLFAGFFSPASGQRKFEFLRGSYQQAAHLMEHNWIMSGGARADSIRVFRAEQGDKAFKQVPVNIYASSISDTLLYRITDSTAQRYLAYQYYLDVRDPADRQFFRSDTILLAALDYIEMPLPTQVTTVADTLHKAIRISWTIPHGALIKEMSLYRSSNSLTGFERIAALNPEQTGYVDEGIKPATPYFYYFVLSYKTQDIIKRSVPFAASFTDPGQPARVINLKAEGTSDGIALQWAYFEPHVQGFWLYRSIGDAPMQLIGQLIPAIDSIQTYRFVDTDSLLNGAKEYQYALKVNSSSHVESLFSDTATARPLKNIPVPKAPIHITAQNDEGIIYVFWEDVSGYDGFASGYQLLRSKKIAGSKETYAAADTLFSPVNFYVDSLAAPNEGYRYSVITRSSLGTASKPSVFTHIQTRSQQVPAPGSLMAKNGKTGVQLQWSLPGKGETLAYHIYRYERGKPPVNIAKSAVGAARYLDQGAVKGRQYFYFLRSVAADHTESRNSNEAGINYE